MTQDQSISKTLPQIFSPSHGCGNRTEATFPLGNRGQEIQSGMSGSCDPFDTRGISAAPDHSQLAVGVGSEGNLPWAVDFDDWWTFDLASTEYEPLPEATVGRY